MIEAAFKGACASLSVVLLIRPQKQTRKKAAFMPKWDVEIPRPPTQQQEVQKLPRMCQKNLHQMMRNEGITEECMWAFLRI